MLGTRIKDIRKSKNLTQQVFASRLGTSSGFVSEIENGLKNPGYDFLLSLKRIFDVDLNWLLTGEGTAPEKKTSQVAELIDMMLEDMNEEAQRDVLKYAEEKKLLAECLKERANKKAA